MLAARRSGLIAIASQVVPGAALALAALAQLGAGAALVGANATQRDGDGARDTIADVELDPFSIDTDRHAGTASPAAPALRPIWSTSDGGAGEQQETQREPVAV